jgi:hypothetical protein
MKGETNKLCFCDCEGFVVDDNYHDPEKGVFGWCSIRKIPITKTETYRDACKKYSFNESPENETPEEKNDRWMPLIGRWLEVHQGYSKWFEENFVPTQSRNIYERFFAKEKKPKYDNVCPSCYGRGFHGCIHMSSECKTCKGYGGMN